MPNIKEQTIKEYFDRLADGWDDRVAHDASKIRWLFSLLDQPPGGRMLDVGCGTGVLIPYVQELLGTNASIVALDISGGMLRIAREKFGDQGIVYVCQAIADYQPDHPFELIICYSCFPHFQHQHQLIHRMSGWLKPGGALAVIHSQGRDQINQFHRETGGCVKDDRLPEGRVLAAWMHNAGLTGIRTVDEHDLYLVGGKKFLPGETFQGTNLYI